MRLYGYDGHCVMIRYLSTENIGPLEQMSLEFGERLNLLTGDNGLGKSFILDLIWWSMTRTWPAELNQKLMAGRMALPAIKSRSAAIRYAFEASSKTAEYESTFDRGAQTWPNKQGRPSNPGIVFYAMADGSVCIWDPARNYWKEKSETINRSHAEAYVFTPSEILNGLRRSDDTWLCNGLIRDWTLWQSMNGNCWQELVSVLDRLSPGDNEKINPGEPVRVSLDDSRDIPTLKLSYQQSVPIIHVSSGMRRIISLAYLLVWAWNEHQKAANLIGQQVSNRMTFLLDEAESHLHPKWQRTLLPALMNVIKMLTNDVEIQLIAATHSPLIMASVENLFVPEYDAWFDLDEDEQRVILTQRTFEKQGDYSRWLKSEAFDLKQSYSLEAELLMNEIEQASQNNSMTPDLARSYTQKLIQILPEHDPYLIRWVALAERKGWLQ